MCILSFIHVAGIQDESIKIWKSQFNLLLLVVFLLCCKFILLWLLLAGVCRGDKNSWYDFGEFWKKFSKKIPIFFSNFRKLKVFLVIFFTEKFSFKISQQTTFKVLFSFHFYCSIKKKLSLYFPIQVSNLLLNKRTSWARPAD